MDEIATLKEHLTVSELNTLIKDVINMGFPNPIWVCGEIQGYGRNKEKKHIFFELCEKDPQSKDIIARIGLVIFAGRKPYIEEILQKAENAFTLKDDIEVKGLCRVDFYPPHGAMRLIVESIDPFYTLGKIAQERQKLIALLKTKGILEKNKQIPLSSVPLNIGLITAFDSAAYNDFIAELKRSGYGFKVFHVNSAVQGKRVEREVCRALDILNRIQTLDAIVVTRGGGSIAELSCFDNRLIAEKIAGLRLPVLSGIGHEINITVTDLAAHTYEKTPTAIAQILVQKVEDFLTSLDEKGYEMIHLAQQKINDEKKSLKNRAVNLHSDTSSFLKTHSLTMVQMMHMIEHQPIRRLVEQKNKLGEHNTNLQRVAKHHLHNVKFKLNHYQRMIEIANPTNTLRRGFTITRTSQQRLIKNKAEVKLQDVIITEVVDGNFCSRVYKIDSQDRPR